MTTRHRVPSGVPTGGRFAPTTHDEAEVALRDGPDTPTHEYEGMSGNRVVSLRQGHLHKATMARHDLAPEPMQDAVRQINAEAHALMCLGEYAPMPDTAKLQANALDRVEKLRLHERVPGHARPMHPKRVKEVADYFEERAAKTVAEHRDDLDKGPTAANAIVNESLWIVARLRNPDANKYALDAERSVLRDQMISAADGGKA